MLIDQLYSLPKDMFEYSNLSLSELSESTGIEYDRLQKIIGGNELPTLEDIDLIQDAIDISDEMIAYILENKKSK